jgi:hypothetical protein
MKKMALAFMLAVSAISLSANEVVEEEKKVLVLTEEEQDENASLVVQEEQEKTAEENAYLGCNDKNCTHGK